MLAGLGLKKYNLLGKTSMGIDVYYQDNSIYIIFPEEAKCNYDIGFYLHIYEKGKTSYYRRDFNYNKIKRDLYTSNVVVINGIKNMARLDIGQWDGKHAIGHSSFMVKKKIVFHIDHYGGLINMIALRHARHINDICILIASVGDDKDNLEILRLLQEYNVFEEVITVLPNSHQIMKMNNPEIIEQEIEILFDTYLSLGNIDLADIDKIYSSFDINGLFTLYLDIKEKKYTLVELGKNQLGYTWRKVDLVKQNLASEAYNNLMCRRGVFDGTSEYCDGEICFSDTFFERKVYNKPVEFVEFSDEIKKFPTQLVETILNRHGVDIEKIKECSVLILPNSKYMTKTLLGDKWEDDRTLARIYALLADYYGQVDEGDVIVFKPHPLTNISFEKYIPNVKSIPKEVPIEIINALSGIKIQQVLAINTTAIEKISNCIDSAVEAGRAFVSYMDDLPKLWFIANFFNVRDINQSIYDKDYLRICMSQLNKISLEKNKIETNSICILKNDCNINVDYNYDFIFVIDEYSDVNIKGYNRFNIKIEVCPFRENSVLDNNNSVIAVFSKDNIDFIGKIHDRIQKHLYCSGANVNYLIEK